MTDAAIKDPYIVKKNDTLSAIAKACGKSASELRRFNKLSNPNRLEIGQTLYLSHESAFGVSVLFLDALRHPIENLRYQIKYDGQIKSGKTPANGLAPRLITKDASSRLEIFVQDQHGHWINVCNVTSDYGHKLTTLVSCVLIFKGATEKHPINAPAKPTSDRAPTSTPAASTNQGQPTQPLPANGTGTKNNRHVKTKKVKGNHEQAIIQVGVDFPEGLRKLFDLYMGEAISAEQWKETAKGLECEVEVIKAIAEVETKGAAFWRLNKADGAQIPSILFERHWFQRLTKHTFDKTHPDISGPAYKSDKNAVAADRYGSYSTSYLRLINAYRLDPSAALCSCSWGKFQIMGGEYKTCGIDSVGTLVKSMCTSESEQIGLLASFIRKKASGKLWKAVKAKDWTNIAFYYNGKDYKKDGYDTKLRTAYEKHKSTHA